MIPRTVRVAASVATQFTSTELQNYGNVILNGYTSLVPNTINKKAWQYKETTTAPVNLPSLANIRPALKGWTNNYQEYYTERPPNAYGQVPGNPTMFQYVVHSFTPFCAAITQVGGILSNGIGYTPGTYVGVPTTTNGSGTGATLRVVVSSVLGMPTTVSLLTGGANYPVSSTFTGASAYTVTGSGNGLKLNGTTNASGSVATVSINPSSVGFGYAVDDIVQVQGGTAQVKITAVSSTGAVTSMSVISPGTGYAVNDVLYPVLTPGSGASIHVTEINTSLLASGGQPRWAQPPRRLINNQVAAFVPPNDNQKAIQYSAILYPSTM